MKKIERKTGRATSGSSGAAKPKPAASPNKAVMAESADNLNLVEIKALIELVAEKQFNEFELERGNFRLRLSKGLAKSAAIAEPIASVEQKVVAAPVAAPQSVAPTSVVEPPPAKEEENLHVVTSPIVGTFYSSPNPSLPAFVAIGDSVQIGKVLCIVEAMKLMNEVVSDASGVIAKVFAENGQPVEYGQPLFGIKK
ncbi:MAG: acetyl-CoA carboxylase biotin carboxyl carrier protein [Blastocatellia bacterium]